MLNKSAGYKKLDSGKKGYDYSWTAEQKRRSKAARKEEREWSKFTERRRKEEASKKSMASFFNPLKSRKK